MKSKLSIHPLFYIVLLICFLTGNFRKITIFTIIIIIHELGHLITGYLLGWKIVKLIIYPYGGCCIFNNDINTKLIKELLVTIMGPLTQIIVVYLLRYCVDKSNYLLFLNYSRLILIFNLIPIYPLDGGKLFNTLLSMFISFYKSLKITIYFSYSVYIISLFLFIKNNYNFLLVLVYLLLLVSLLKEINKVSIYYEKFLLERYLNKYSFKKYKSIDNIYKMKRDYYHTINSLDEKIYLKKYYMLT